jgi:cell division protein FtsW
MKGRTAAMAALAALAVLCALQLFAMLRAPAAHRPERITITLARGASIEVGRQELAAPGAGARQLSLRRADDGSWWLRNLRRERPLSISRDGERQRNGTTRLRAGQRIRIGQTLFSITRVDGDTADFTGAGHQWQYDGARVRREGVIQPACPDGGLRAAWNRWAPRFAAIDRPLAFGGNLHCGNRIGIPYSEPSSATLRAGLLSATIPILVDGADPALADIPLAGVQAIGIGRSRLALRAGQDALHLLPERDVTLFAERAHTLPPQVRWHWVEHGLWDLPGAATGPALLLLACAALLAARRYPCAIPAAITVAGIAAMAMQRAGTPPGMGVSMLLAWAALWCFLRMPRPLGPAGMAGVLLLGLGLLAQLELALGADASHWARHVQKSCALLAIGLGAGGVLRMRAGRLPPRRQVEWLLAALALAALGALGLQVLFGDETGVFDLQPVEFAKLSLVALTAHCIAVGLGAHAEPQAPFQRWLRLAAPVLLLAALFALALVQVNDYSPLLLLLLWCAGVVLAWAAVTRRIALAALLLSAVMLASAGVATLRGADAGQLSAWGFYPDRFEVWLDPAGHPHTGQQMLLAGRAIAQGDWWGADRLLGLSSLGRDAGSVLAIPAVQDDFAPSFFLNRHGLAGALVLWLLQATFLLGLLRTAAQALGRGARARDFRLAWLGRFQGFALCGGAAFVLGHLLLSWGTNLGVLPIMGQPMSFLSAGGSHLLFFICPLLTLDAISTANEHALDHQRRIDHAGLRTT